jgi:pimeloyl-ACP methyl ester carboxylesterase
LEAPTRYAKSGNAHVAYSVTGEGPATILYVSCFTLSIDSLDEEPHVAQYFQRLAGFSRLIRFDLRGVGLSDPIDLAQELTVDDVARDALAVLDACGTDAAAIVADNGGCPVAIELAAAHPERVSGLVLIGAFARLTVGDDYALGYPADAVTAFIEQNMDPDESWSALDGSDDLALIAPSLRGDERFVEWWVRSSRRGASPASAKALVTMSSCADVRDRLGEIAVPMLVIHRSRDQFVPKELGRYVAERVEGARFVELPGADHAPWTAASDEITDEIEDFLTGHRTSGGVRVLATVVFTDIVDSTGRAAALGDRAWRAYLESHDAIVRAELRRYDGREVNTTGDGFFAAFESPTQAVRCAEAIVRTATAQGIAVRVGAHTGECERRGDDLAGLTVHIAARVSSLAASGEVLVSRTVRDLVAGSGFGFVDRGDHELKGVPESWQLFALEA